jgi:hypothetical protein|tara:strand:+ start:996 stop:1214 length:219 start_codon:yes stop_codon:yes gene_type:complete
MTNNKELLAQRDFIDDLLATQTTDHERKETMKLMDDIYFSPNLPDNVIPFPLNKVKRLHVNIPPEQSSKKNI